MTEFSKNTKISFSIGTAVTMIIGMYAWTQSDAWPVDTGTANEAHAAIINDLDKYKECERILHLQMERRDASTNWNMVHALHDHAVDKGLIALAANYQTQMNELQAEIDGLRLLIINLKSLTPCNL